MNHGVTSLRNLCYGMTFANRERCICFDVSSPRRGNFMNEISFSFRCIMNRLFIFFTRELLQMFGMLNFFKKVGERI